MTSTPPVTVAQLGQKRRGRAKATGRYETREELCAMVWRLYQKSPAKVADIARATRVSEGVVHKILDSKEGMPSS